MACFPLTWSTHLFDVILLHRLLCYAKVNMCHRLSDRVEPYQLQWPLAACHRSEGLVSSLSRPPQSFRPRGVHTMSTDFTWAGICQLVASTRNSVVSRERLPSSFSFFSSVTSAMMFSTFAVEKETQSLLEQDLRRPSYLRDASKGLC